MKKLLALLFVLSTFTTFAQGHVIDLKFWDGTFMYNQLLVNSVPHQQNIVTLRLSGSHIGLANQIEGIPQRWGIHDLLEVSVLKKDCKIDTQAPRVECHVDKVSVKTLSWTINHKLTKVYSGVIENLKVLATNEQVSVSFTVPTDEYFAPHQEDIQVAFPLGRHTF